MNLHLSPRSGQPPLPNNHARYDALGRMVEQNRSGAYTEIAYTPTGSKLATMTGQTVTRAFLPLPGGAMAVYTSTGLSYYRHPDWLGSARLRSNPNRTFSGSMAYGPIGEPYAQAGTVDVSFTGQNQDTTTTVYDFPAREYGFQGRWPSPDPGGVAAVDLDNPQTFNRYAYVTNAPCELVDPLGFQDGCGQDPRNPGVPAAGSVNLRPGVGGSGQFGSSRSTNGHHRKHHGIDISDSPGNSLYPFLDGTVTFSGNADDGLGLKIIVNAGGGYSYEYGHLTASLVGPGDTLDPDTVMGYSGTSGNASHLPPTEAHVHLEVHDQGTPVDPMLFMKAPCPPGVKDPLKKGKGSGAGGGGGGRGDPGPADPPYWNPFGGVDQMSCQIWLGPGVGWEPCFGAGHHYYF